MTKGRCKKHQRRDTRPSAYRRGYDRRWRKIREQHLRREPLCRNCGLMTMMIHPLEVDHIDGDPTNNAPSNLRTLCKPCHSARTMRDQVNG